MGLGVAVGVGLAVTVGELEGCEDGDEAAFGLALGEGLPEAVAAALPLYARATATSSTTTSKARPIRARCLPCFEVSPTDIPLTDLRFRKYHLEGPPNPAASTRIAKLPSAAQPAATVRYRCGPE